MVGALELRHWSNESYWKRTQKRGCQDDKLDVIQVQAPVLISHWAQKNCTVTHAGAETAAAGQGSCASLTGVGIMETYVL